MRRPVLDCLSIPRNPPVPPFFPGQRNFPACTQYYDGQWKQAVKAKIITPTGPLCRAVGQLPQVTESGRKPTIPNEADRGSSPTRSLQALSAVGIDVSGNATTSDFSTCAHEDLVLAADDDGMPNDFSLEQCYDAEGIASAEIICDNCRGVGHPRRLCPSPRRFRTFDFAIALLFSAKERADNGAQRDGRPPGGKRTPPRGQRPPFRPRARKDQPRRFSTQHSSSSASTGVRAIG